MSSAERLEQTAAGPVVLRGNGLTKHFSVRADRFGGPRSVVRAVQDVDLELRAGECLALVGESGCGKSTLANLLTRLEPLTSGRLEVGGRPVTGSDRHEMRAFRRTVQIVLQDPYSALDPRMTVESLVGEPLSIHSDLIPKRQRAARISELLAMVGLDDSFRQRYPHEFSGGQRQRVCIARALAVSPKILVCDEPLSALDASIQGQILELFGTLRRQLGLSYIFISHDLAVVRSIADRVAVMYLGRIIEQGTTEQVYGDPQHPYTQALLSAAPSADPTRRDRRDRIRLSGEVPSPLNPPSGCPFRTRCWRAVPRCATEPPHLLPIGPGGDHQAACYRIGETDAPPDATG